MPTFYFFAVFILSFCAHANERKPAQIFMTPPSSTTPSQVGGTPEDGSFKSENIQTGQQVIQVYCIMGPGQSYQLGVTGVDVQIRRVSAGGTMTYEVYKDNKFTGSCPLLHVISK